MIHIEKIESFDLPALAPYQTMRRQLEHRTEGIFVAEGEKVVRRLLESKFTVVSVLMPEKWLGELSPLIEARPERVEVFIAEKPLLEQLTGFSMYQGLLAVGKVPGILLMEELLAKSQPPRLFVAMEGLSSAENLGTIVRNCAAFGVQGLIVGETCSSPYLRRAVRSSMGTVFELPIVESRNLAHDLHRLRLEKILCIAAHPQPDSTLLWNTDLSGDCCIVVGSEGNGISADILKCCDTAAAIPMAARVDSLNVGSATAAFLSEVSRQRGNIWK